MAASDELGKKNWRPLAVLGIFRKIPIMNI